MNRLINGGGVFAESTFTRQKANYPENLAYWKCTG